MSLICRSSRSSNVQISTSWTKKSRGQSVMEFALLLPILILLVIGATDLGRAYHVTITLNNAAREGTRQAVYDARVQRAGDIRNAVIREATNSGITLTAGDITLTCGESGAVSTQTHEPLCAHLTPLRVTVCQDFTLILQFLFTDTYQICRYAEMMVP